MLKEEPETLPTQEEDETIDAQIAEDPEGFELDGA